MCARCQAYIVHKTRWHYDGSIKDAKITLKQYLIDGIFFVLHILCFGLLWYLLTKNVDSSIRYVIHRRKPIIENKKENIIVSFTIIHIYIFCTIWFCIAYFMYEKQFSCLTLMHFTMHIVITRSLYVWFLTPLLSRFIKTRV